MDLNYNYFKVFLAVARLGNITLASKALKVSQPSVSLTIQNLENTIGKKLFERLPRGMQLTADGESLYGCVSDGFDLITQGVVGLATAKSQIRRVLEISGSQSIICTKIVGDLLASYRAEEPFVRVRLRGCTAPETIRRVSIGLSNVGFVYSPVTLGGACKMVELVETDAVFIVGPGKYKFLSETVQPLNEILRYPIVSYSRPGYGRFFWSELFSAGGFVPDAELDVSSTEMMLSAVKENCGIGILLRQSAEYSLRKGFVFEVKVKDLVRPRRKLCMILPKESSELSHIRSFVDAVQLRSAVFNEEDSCRQGLAHHS